MELTNVPAPCNFNYFGYIGDFIHILYVIFLVVIIGLIIKTITSHNSKALLNHQRFIEEYNKFLTENEGLEIFCYTNRLKFCDTIETQLIPTLDKHIHIVKLIGKTPETHLEQRFISYALYRINEVGFPNVMKIVNSKFIDISLHKQIYNAINNNKVDSLPLLIDEKLKKLRAI